MPEYTLATVIAVVVLIAVELLWTRTGIFTTVQYWLTMVIVFFFQVLVDGWLTKLVDPIVRYSPQHFLGVRFPFDIPIEDYGFGFVLVTGAILGWLVAGRKYHVAPGSARRASSSGRNVHYLAQRGPEASQDHG